MSSSRSGSRSRSRTHKYQKPSQKPQLATIQEKSNENNSSNDSDIITAIRAPQKINILGKLNVKGPLSNKVSDKKNKNKSSIKQFFKNIASFLRPSATKKKRSREL